MPCLKPCMTARQRNGEGNEEKEEEEDGRKAARLSLFLFISPLRVKGPSSDLALKTPSPSPFYRAFLPSLFAALWCYLLKTRDGLEKARQKAGWSRVPGSKPGSGEGGRREGREEEHLVCGEKRRDPGLVAWKKHGFVQTNTD